MRKQSKKRAKENRQYLKIIIEILSENPICPVTGELATELHHKKGRQGYADKWARDNDIPLLIDRRYLLPVSEKGHRRIELNPIWAKEKGFSLSRLSNN